MTDEYHAKSYRDYDANLLSDVQMVNMTELLNNGFSNYTLNFNVVKAAPHYADINMIME